MANYIHNLHNRNSSKTSEKKNTKNSRNIMTEDDGLAKLTMSREGNPVLRGSEAQSIKP
jgi:hypothetical protein